MFRIVASMCLVLILLAGCQAIPAAAPAAPAPAATAPAATEPTAMAPQPTVAPVLSSPTAVPVAAAPVPTEPVAQPVLEIAGSEASKFLTLDDLKALSITEGNAGFKSSTGKITAPLPHRGVSLKDLAELVGPLDETMGVNVVAKDGYGITFSYDQLTSGAFTAYDPATGDEIAAPEGLTAIVAFEREGQPLPEDADGTLRVVVISPKDDQVTDGHWSVKWVVRLEVKPLGADWDVTFKGAITEVIDRGSFESCVQCHKATWTDDKAQEWIGVPLYLLAGYVDDEIKHQGPAFNDALAEAGYTVDVVSADGFTATFDSARVARNNNILAAYLVNENPLPEQYFPLRLVGNDVDKKEQVGAIEEIVVVLDGQPDAAPEPTAAPAPTKAPAEEAAPVEVKGDIVLVGMVTAPTGFTEAELRAIEVLKVTVEHPKSGPMAAEGVRLSTLLARVQPAADAKTLVITAADGYSSEVALAEVQACADCMVAFTETPGKFRLAMPGLSSGLWVKDVVKLELK